MTIGQLIFWYILICFILVTALVVAVVRHKGKAGAKSVLRSWTFLYQWRSFLPSAKPRWLEGDFLLRLSLATLIGLSVGVIIALIILPYGELLAAVALLAALAGLIVFLPRLLT